MFGTSQYDFKNQAIKPPPSSYKVGASRAGNVSQAGQKRPQSNRGMNFTNNLKDKANDIYGGTRYSLKADKKTDNPEENFKRLEKELNTLVHESTGLRIGANYMDALEKAKEATNKDKNIKKQKENLNMNEQINHELAFLVALNHALCLEANGMIQEAHTKYLEITKKKQYQFAGRVRVNIGNLHYKQQKYGSAVQMYKKAYDVLPSTSKEMRFKITKNIGHCHAKLGEYSKAIHSYEQVLKNTPDQTTAYNLIICLYSSGDKLRMKDCFTSMITNPVDDVEEEEEEENDGVMRNDKLKEELKAKRREEIRYIINAAKLIAPAIENTVIESYDWILEKLKTSSYPEVESEIEIFKAMTYLRNKEIEKAIETLKGLEKKDKSTMSRVASNISFLYFLENNYAEAERYVDIAINSDRYNSRALVNKGNCLYMRNDFRRAKEHYLEAIGVEADCIEALYNLGYVNKKLNLFMESLQALQKIQTLIALPETMFQVANINQIIGKTKQALKWYQVILTKYPNDAGILARVGNIFFREDDEQQALHYYLESYRLLPTNIETNTWLGIYYVKQSIYEKACFYLQRASQIQPKEVKWRLMVASCQRRIGSFQKALKIYESIYEEYPDNLECLRFMTILCKDMGLDYEEYAKELRRLEMENEAVGADYENNDLRDINEEEENNEPANIKIRNNRVGRELNKNQKQQEDNSDDDIDLGV